MYYFYTSNQGRGRKYPIVKNEQGDVMVYDRKTIKPLPQFTDRLLRDNLALEKEQIDRFFDWKCIEVKVNSISELCGWLDKYDKLVLKKRAAEESLKNAENNLFKILKEETNMYPDKPGMPKKSYSETKAMGCTDIVYWKYESLTNPETGNEFFRPEEAKKLLENRKKEYFEKYKNELEEKEKEHNKGNDYHFPDEIEDINDSCYIWENADLLEDLVWQEEKGLFQE